MTVVIRFSAPVKAEAKIIYVDAKNTGFEDGSKEYPYNTIKEGINAAASGDTVFVYNGTYRQSFIVLDKDNLSLIGENRDFTIIDSMRMDWVLVITAQNITVTGFTIQNGSLGTGGVFLDYAVKSKISDNIIKNHLDSGIYARFSNGNVIENNWMSDNYAGIVLSSLCTENKVSNNDVIGNTRGIDLSHHARYNDVRNNNIVQNTYGLSISHENNSVFGNRIVNNDVGVYEDLEVGAAHGYRIVHNNFINNTKQVDLRNSSVNAWDNGLEGNYWSDYNGTDFTQDGIGDTAPYIINGNNTDRYPLMGTFAEFPVTWEETNYYVTTICNSTMSAFKFDQFNKMMKFNVTVEEGLGFCRVTIPKIIIQDMWHKNYKVLVDGEDPLITNNWTDTESTYIYFTYQYSEHEVVMTPELPTWISMLLVLMVLTVAVAIYKRGLQKTPIH